MLLVVTLINYSLFNEKNQNKLRYVYSLTPKGVSARTKLTLDFMKRKMKEYDELKSEIEEN